MAYPLIQHNRGSEWGGFQRDQSNTWKNQSARMEVTCSSPVEGCDFKNNWFLKDWFKNACFLRIYAQRELHGIVLLGSFLRVQPGVLVKFQKRSSQMGSGYREPKCAVVVMGLEGSSAATPWKLRLRISARHSKQWASFMESTKHTEKCKSAHNIYQATRELTPAYSSFSLGSYFFAPY